MALQPFFSLTALNPESHTYNPANPSAPYASAFLYAYGGITFFSPPFSLADQYRNNSIILGFDPVDPSSQTIGSVIDDFDRHCGILVAFYGRKVTEKNQYLLIFALQGIQASPYAQFFVGTDLVRIEQLSGSEQVAILMDCPGDATWTYVYIRLASQNYWAAMGFNGVDCYLL